MEEVLKMTYPWELKVGVADYDSFSSKKKIILSHLIVILKDSIAYKIRMKNTEKCRKLCFLKLFRLLNTLSL